MGMQTYQNFKSYAKLDLIHVDINFGMFQIIPMETVGVAHRSNC